MHSVFWVFEKTTPHFACNPHLIYTVSPTFFQIPTPTTKPYFFGVLYTQLYKGLYFDSESLRPISFSHSALCQESTPHEFLQENDIRSKDNSLFPVFPSGFPGFNFALFLCFVEFITNHPHRDLPINAILEGALSAQRPPVTRHRDLVDMA